MGTIIDDKLSFGQNINHICKKVGQKISVLGRLRNELSCDQKLTIYKSIVQPHFVYCATITYLSNETDLNRLQLLQNKCLRTILRVDKYSNVIEMLKSLNLMSVRQLIMYRTLIFICKLKMGLTPSYLSSKIVHKHETTNRQLRNGNEIAVPNLTKACSQNSLFYKGIKLFNSLPTEIKNCDSVNNCAKILKDYVINNY